MRQRVTRRWVGAAAGAVMLGGLSWGATACGGDDASVEPDESIVLSDPTAMPSPSPLPTATLPVATVITPDAGAAMLADDPSVVLIDVRTPEEFAAGHIEGAQNLDLEGGELTDALATLDPDATYVVYCRSGNRSAVAAGLMEQAGLTVYDMGGIQAWQATGRPVVEG